MTDGQLRWQPFRPQNIRPISALVAVAGLGATVQRQAPEQACFPGWGLWWKPQTVTPHTWVSQTVWAK